MKNIIPARSKSLAAACALAALAAVTFAAATSAAPQRNNDLQQQDDAPPFSSPDPRDRAVHDCSVEASKYGMSTWQSTQLDVYGECMGAHNQPP